MMNVPVVIGITIVVVAYIWFIGSVIMDSINEEKKEAEKRKERET